MLEHLRRWELSGGLVRVIHLSDARAEVELRACTGEVMERVSSTAAEVIDYLTSRGEADSGVDGERAGA
jgi:hypothetical protein